MRELNLFCFTVDRSHVLSRLNVEKDRTGVADVTPLVRSDVAYVAPLVKTSLVIKTIFLISLRFTRDNNWIPLTISLKLTGSKSSKMEIPTEG